MLKERIVSGVIMLIGFVVINFFIPDSLFKLSLAVLTGIAGWEWSRLTGIRDSNHQIAVGCLFGLAALIILWLLPLQSLAATLSLANLLFWLCVIFIFVLKPVRQALKETPDYFALFLGAALLLSCVVFMDLLHNRAFGGSPWLLLYVLSVVWVMDIGAYFSGKRLGKRKLAPLISPGKTQEGVLGGIVFAVALLVLILMTSEFAREHSYAFVVGSLLAACVSVMGDLFESRLKRAAGMKDSSQLIKGHGGVLDRIDGVIASIPVFAFAWTWL